MTGILSLLGVITTFVIIIAVVFIVSRVLGSNIWTVKRNKIFLLSYIGLGAICFIILFFATEGEPERVSKEEMQAVLVNQDKIWQMFDSKNIEEIDEAFLAKESSYELPTNKLTISPIYTDIYGVSIVVEKREDPASNEIFAKTYVTPHILEGYDLTEYVQFDRFEFKDSELIINQVPQQKVQYYKVTPTMEILEQFRDWDLENDDIYNYATGSTILFLNVPEHVKIIDESGYILVES
nr:hypothetical protein [Lysinibacillus timonensis]